MCNKYVFSGVLGVLRHADDHEVQPVPWVLQKCKTTDTESSGQNFDRCFKRVDESEHVPVQRQKRTSDIETLTLNEYLNNVCFNLKI